MMENREIVEKLMEKTITVATAESCTGGMIASAITDVPGSSGIFGYGMVTYSNEAKRKILGVQKETLEQYGAVSEQTAREMAQGLRERSGADIAVSTTGIAGPSGGTKDKPVGLVYVGCADAHGVRVEKLTLTGSRERIRNLAALRALDMIRRAAMGY